MRTIQCRLTCLLVLLTLGHGKERESHAAMSRPPESSEGATVLTGAGKEIADADLVVRGGRIVAVGKRGDVEIPEGPPIEDVGGMVIIPGLVDTHSHIGIYPKPGIEAHSDGNEMTGPYRAGFGPLDAIWPEDPGIRMALAGRSHHGQYHAWQR